MADHEIHELAKKIRYDLTALQAKVTELMQMAAKLPEPDDDTRSCPECGLSIKALPQGCTLADHRRRAHDIRDELAASPSAPPTAPSSRKKGTA